MRIVTLILPLPILYLCACTASARAGNPEQVSVTTLAGWKGTSGLQDGTGTAARFTNPYGITILSNGLMIVADSYNHAIRRVTASGVVTTLAGLMGSSGTQDGTGTAARFTNPYGIATLSNGNVVVADRDNHAIRVVTAGGVVTTLAG